MIHCHRHSEYSLLDGCGTADQYAKRAAEMNQTALALTDHGTLSGTLHHFKACQNAGIMPILGVEAYWRENRKLHSVENKEWGHLVLLARNLKGWNNLLRLTSASYDLDSFYYKPCIDWDLLERYAEGVTVLSACISSPLCRALIAGDDAHATSFMERMRIITQGHFWLEIQPHDLPQQHLVNAELVNLGLQFGVGVIATNDAHYPYADWSDTQDVVQMIATNQSLKERAKKREAGEDVYEMNVKTLYLMSETEMQQAFVDNHPQIPPAYVAEAIRNTHRLVEGFGFFVIDPTDKLPKIQGGASQAERTVRAWCDEGLLRIGQHDSQTYRDRLEWELGVLSDARVLDYFAIIGDLVRHAREDGIRVGAGRGSAAGSLVAYLIRITSVDPIAHGLLFERFLNPHRKGLPDIDLDFPSRKARLKAKDYLAEKYGKDHVADIITHSTWGAKSALQDVCRVYNVPFEDAVALTAKLDDSHDSLEKLKIISPAVMEFASVYPEAFRHAVRLQGQCRTASKHAAGVVVTDRPVSEYMPTMRAKDGSTVTAWSDSISYPIISTFGFLKIDLLVTDVLEKQEIACQLIRETCPTVNLDLDSMGILHDPTRVDPKVLKEFALGHTLGVFQFEGSGITGLLRAIKPDRFEDLAAANALHRPGPLDGGVAFQYAKNKHEKYHGLQDWPEIARSVMAPTYGVIAYQEQVMQLVQVMAGFSPYEADDFRTAIGKLYRLPGDEAKQYMNRYYGQWEAGTAQRGVEHFVMDAVWHMILAFGGYGFNKSHSVAYSLIAYQDMWLKYYYPTQFYAAILSMPDKKKKGEERHPRLLREALARGIKVLPPDINRSGFGFTAEAEGIRFGLSGVKGIADASISAVLEYRPFCNLQDVDRVPARRLNRRHKECLVAAGALDCFDARSEWSQDECALAEQEGLGIPLSSPLPLMRFANLITAVLDTAGAWMVVGGEVTEVKAHKTKRGEQMGFVTLAFGADSWRLTLFPAQWQQYKDDLAPGGVLIAKARRNEKGIHATNVWDAESYLRGAVAPEVAAEMVA